MTLVLWKAVLGLKDSKGGGEQSCFLEGETSIWLRAVELEERKVTGQERMEIYCIFMNVCLL